MGGAAQLAYSAPGTWTVGGEAVKHLAGYDLVDCESLERAEAIAARIPDARLVAVEVRRVMDLPDVEM
jgi:hypothetical protein